MGVIDISAARQATLPLRRLRIDKDTSHLKNQMATFEQRYIQKDNSIPKPLMSFQHCEN